MAENNGTSRRLISAALILSSATFVSAAVGLVRERTLTATFGAGDVFDAFVAALRIPDFIFNLVVLGALSASFIPLFTASLVKNKSPEAAFRFSLSVLNFLLLVIVSLSVVYFLVAPWLVPIITPGFSGSKLELTISLSRIMALQPILLSISFVFSGILNSFKRFIVYALAPILYNTGIIGGVLLLYPRVGEVGLAWGVVLGAALHLLVQVPSILAVGWRWRPVLDLASTRFRAMWRMMLPRTFGLAAQQINLLLVTIIGSRLAAGSIAIFHLANNVQYLPVSIFGLAFAQAAFPTLAEQAAGREWKSFRDTLSRAFRYILFFVIPVSVFFFLLRAQLIRVLFGAGRFDWDDTILTFSTFGWMIFSIFAQATIPLLTRAFYVQEDTKTPVIISLISVGVNIGLASWLGPRFGVEGLAVAFSVAAIVNVLLLLGRLHWQLGGFNDREVLSSLWRIALAAIIAGLILQGLKYPVAAVVNMQRFWGVFLQLIVAGGGGTAAFVGLCWLLRCEEVRALYRYVPRRWKPLPTIETTRFIGHIE